MENSVLSLTDDQLMQTDSWPMGFSKGQWIAHRYQLRSFLGEGGMGCVFKAHDRYLDRMVAVKFMKRSSATAERHMLREARLQALVDHDHICKVFEVGRHEGLYFLTMQYIQGLPLHEAVREWSLEAKLLLMAKVAGAVHEAHGHGLIHRDIKPNNILVCEEVHGHWKPYVMDFGLARRMEEPHSTKTGLMQGTPHFMAPEQVRGLRQGIDRRTDVYGLGATIYYLLAGCEPHSGDNHAALLWAIMAREVPSLRNHVPSLPRDIDAVVSTALAKEPQRRYGSALALADDLKRYLQGEPVKANPLNVWERGLYAAKRHRRSLIFGFASILAVLLVLVWGVFARQRLAKQAQITREFIERAEEVEAFYRRETMLPLHDLTPAKKHLQAQMAELANRMKVLGELAHGPGHIALGRAHLAMGNYEKAQHHLQIAWDSGIRDAPLALTMGHAMNGSYQLALSQSESLADADQRQKVRQNAQRNYLVPAKALLLGISNWQDDQQLEAQALLSAFGEQELEALRYWERLAHVKPWYYEAWLYQGQALIRLGIRCRDRGDLKSAKGHYDAAREKLARGLRIGRSDPENQLAMADLHLAQLVLARENSQKASQETFEAALKSCEMALQMDPSQAEAYRILSVIMVMNAESQLKSGLDPTEACDQALEYAQASNAIKPDVATVYNSMGMIHLLKAQFAVSRGKNPLDSFKQAIDSLEQGVKLQPHLTALHNSLGVANLYLFQVLSEPPYQDSIHYRKAIHHLEEAKHQLPQRIQTWVNLGAAHWMLGEAQFFTGEDPREALCQAREAFEAILKMQPNHVTALLNLGNALQLFGEYQWERRQPSREYFENAMNHFYQAARMNPQLLEAEMGVGISFLNLAKLAWFRGQSPFGYIDESLKAINRALLQRPDWDVGLFNMALAQMWEARFLHGLGGMAHEPLSAKASTVEELLRINSQFADAWVILGDLERLKIASEATWEPIWAAQSFYQKALRIDPSNGFGLLGMAYVQLETWLQEPLVDRSEWDLLAETAWLLNLARRGGAPAIEVARLFGLVNLMQASLENLNQEGGGSALKHGLNYVQEQLDMVPQDGFYLWLHEEFLRLVCSESFSKESGDGLTLRDDFLEMYPNLTRLIKRFSGGGFLTPLPKSITHYL